MCWPWAPRVEPGWHGPWLIGGLRAGLSLFYAGQALPLSFIALSGHWEVLPAHFMRQGNVRTGWCGQMLS